MMTPLSVPPPPPRSQSMHAGSTCAVPRMHTVVRETILCRNLQLQCS